MNHKANILVADDEAGMRDTLAAILEDEGYGVIVCGGGRAALKHLEETTIDVVISDLNLPDISGLEILMALKHVHPDAPFILITGHATVETAVEAMNKGAFAYHVKPFDPGAIHNSVRNALKQRRLQMENKDLLEMLSRSNEELKAARDAAIEASRTKSEFLSTMSHEIRTPLNSILGMADLLSTTRLSPEQYEYVRVFRTSGETLLVLINDILDLSRVEAGQVVLEEIEFDLVELIDDVAEFLVVSAHERGLELNCRVAPDVPATVKGDPVRLRQVLTNLIGNAIKFTEDGEVNVDASLRAGTDGTDYLQFQVIDTGIGIPEEKLDIIFDSFTQADASTTRQHGGTGLGLAICCRLVELMGGRIWVESKEGRGSRFSFTVSVDVDEESRVVPARDADLEGLDTLVVDDNSTGRANLKEMLGSWGASVIEAEDGYQALVLANRSQVGPEERQVVLLDSQMPGMDGFVVAEELSTSLGSLDRVVMMLKSDHLTGDLARCRQMGISNYVVKPVRRSQLLKAIKAAVNGTVGQDEEGQPADPAMDVPDTERPLRILLVEDSRDNRLLIQAYLKRTAYKMDMAENGQVAFDKFVAGAYDVVLMDMRMPIVDGYTATQMIRKWEREAGVASIPIIALTAHALQEDAQKSLEAGCDAHVTKPVKMMTLIEAINDHTRGVRV